MSRQELQAKLLREAEEARMTALEDARRREEAERQKANEEERRRAEEKRLAEEEAARKESGVEPAPVPEPTAPTEPEAVAAPAAGPAEEAPATEEAEASTATTTTTTTNDRPPPRKFTPVAAPKRPEPKPARTKGDHDRRQSGKLTVNRALNDGGDGGARARSLAALKRAREKEKRLMGGGMREPQAKQVRDVVVPEAITVQELANRMAEKGADLVKSLIKMGTMVTVNQTIDQDTAELLVEEFGHRIQRVSESDVDINTGADVDEEETLKARPPVVTIMGHVDHGKTSLLDALRGTDVVAGQTGGITQHIGAYQVKTKDNHILTFLDTPGHEAFTEMRARGANVTDIVILVVAADDGLMPQTIEAINHTKAAGVPMIVAINKIDKENANPQRVRERLLEHEIVVEDMGGDVQDVEVSALKKIGLDALIDKVMLQAEIMEMKANPDRADEGTDRKTVE